jgi:hypothetical protein
MSIESGSQPKVLQIYLELAQYPILASQIRRRMRQEVFARGVISRAEFEQEAIDKAIQSQLREGLTNPVLEEPEDAWRQRLSTIREHLTDFYFAYNLPHERFSDIVQEVLAPRTPGRDVLLTFNPELAPWSHLFAQAEAYDQLPAREKEKVKHHLQEIIVVLIKAMISDQLAFVGLARQAFTIHDLKEIRRRRIGRGKIGGKAAGMLLAWKILQEEAEAAEGPDLRAQVVIPDSYFVGADVFYDFLSINDLLDTLNQKYKSRERIETDYPAIRQRYIGGCFPTDIMQQFQALLDNVGSAPLIVRSSSLLEDNFGTSFAGKYDSFFLPNQGAPERNLEALTQAISKVYASVPSPDAILYRQHMGLIDYDERMAVLIQKVQGHRYGRYFFPALAGVGFSHNPFRWNRKIQAEDGFLRMVWGLGTRAVERVAGDYPRMVALSHPLLRPEVGAEAIRHYSQNHVDLIDLEDNAFKTLPVSQVLQADYPALRWLVSVDRGGYLKPMLYAEPGLRSRDMVLTFERLLGQTGFVPLMKALLRRLEEGYGRHVDVEFTIQIEDRQPKPAFQIRLLQCRPQSSHDPRLDVALPEDLPDEDVIFRACRLVPHGSVSDVRYVVYVDPVEYSQTPDYTVRLQLARVIGHLNKVLENHTFILMGPGRWGSSNPDLGLKVTYADIHNSRMLVEIAHGSSEGSPEVSYGTHFFQDLVEAQIYPLPLLLSDPETRFNRAFFEDTPNALTELVPEDAPYADYVHVIHVPVVTGGRKLKIVMDSEASEALAYLE